jgi:carboxypeptidase Q
MTPRSSLLLLLALPALSNGAAAQGAPEDIARIIDEGKNNSHVWQTLEYLSHEIGPRLTGSTRLARANAWTRNEFRRLGLTGCANVKWGEVPVRFDRGACSARMTAPIGREFEFTSPAWSAGTDGPVAGPLLTMPTTAEELEAVSGQLEGAWVLTDTSGRRRRRGETDEQKAARELRGTIEKTVKASGIAGIITGSRNDQVTTHGSWNKLTMDNLPTDVSIQVRRGDFEAMQEQLAAGEAVEVEIDLAHYFIEGPFPVYNTIAEIRGSEKPDEVIILSAHLDSWDGPGSQGTQDNGTGSSVMLEAARILMAAGVQPKRTIRFCLWTGEEQGLYGSRGYVASLSDGEKERISAAFVDDGGTNYQGGLNCIAAMKPMLDEAIAPLLEAFPEYEVINIVQDKMPAGGSSDHASFNRAGVPGFFWMEKGKGGREEKTYRYVWHTQNDTTRYAVEEYLIQSATCSAVTAFNLAQAETLLPRENGPDVAEVDGDPTPVDATFKVVAGGLTGPWILTPVGGDVPDFKLSADLQVAADGRVRGSMNTPVGVAKISGSFDPETGTAQLKAKGDGDSAPMSLTLTDDGLAGVIEYGGEIPVTGRRLETLRTPISGDWVAYLDEVDATVALRFEVGADNVLRGWFKSSQSDSPIYGGEWDAKAGTVDFEYDYPHAGRLPVSAKLEGEALVGTIGSRMNFRATRKTTDG